MSNRNGTYANRPQVKTNPALNENMTPDVPKFNSNAMDNQGFIPLNNSSKKCSCNHGKHDNHKH